MKNLGKKFSAAAVAAVLCTALTACGSIEDESSKDAGTVSSDSISESSLDNSSDNVESYNDESSEDGSSDSSVQSEQSSSESEAGSDTDEIPDITGSFMESVNGEESGYVIINDSSSGYLIGKDAHIGVPLEYTLTADTILVNRAGMDDSAEQTAYTYSDGVITFTEKGSEHKWTKLEYISLHGTYYEVDKEGTYLSQWEFNSDGTGKIKDEKTGEETSISYEQTSDSITVTNQSTGEKTDYTYEYNIVNLSLSAADGTVLNFDADQSADTQR